MAVPRPAAAAASAVARCGRSAVVCVAATSGGAALVHAVVCPPHMEENATVGVLFLVLCLAQLAWSAVILSGPSAGLLMAGATGNALVVALWLCTRTGGLPFGPGRGRARTHRHGRCPGVRV